MDLLPKSHTEFTSPEYWDSFFKKRGQKAFEWYGEYSHLCGVLHKYCRPAERLLMVGCGNSRLSEDMYDVGYRSIVNVDISDTVIRQMRERNAKSRDALVFEKMDVTQMSYEDGSFAAAVDKGTLDALAVDQGEATLATVTAMFDEVSRVLRLGGRYVIVSLLQDQVIRALLGHFGQCCWPIRVHRLASPPEEGKDSFSLPVFVVVVTKFKDMPNMKQIVEVCSGEGGSAQRLESIEDLLTTVKEMQYYGIVRQQLATKKGQKEQLSLCLYSHVADQPRYTLTVVDAPQSSNNKFAIFIVPQGRENEWMFSTEAGRASLAESAGFQRLVVASLSRHHDYANMDAVKAELAAKVMELAPPDFKHGTQVPYLSLGGDIGQRVLRHRGTSDMTGSYVVEDAEGSSHWFRRLVFSANQNVIQSEVRLIQSPVEKKKKKKGGKKASGSLQIDKGYLSCQHHTAMVAGLTFLPEEVAAPRVLLVGLGGGPLAAFIKQHFSQVQLDVVEIDEEMSRVARDWFGFQGDVPVHIADGLEFVADLAQKGETRDVVMFDVDCKDGSTGLSCPPPAFVTQEFLTKTASVLTDQGVFILNMACRDDALTVEVLDRIEAIFSNVACINISQEVNTIIMATKCAWVKATGNATTESLKDNLCHTAKRLDSQIRKVSSPCDVDLEECIREIEILRLNE